MIDVNTAGEVWIFAEQRDGQLADTPLELLSKGRELAGKLGVKLATVLMGRNVAGFVRNWAITGRIRYIWWRMRCWSITRRTRMPK